MCMYLLRSSVFYYLLMCNGPNVDLDGLMGYEDGVVECDRLGGVSG